MIKNKKQILPAGATLQNGKYTIERTLGTGSFGITYLALAKMQMEGPLGSVDVDVKVAVKEFFMNEVNSRDTSRTYQVEGSTGNAFSYYRSKFRKEAENLSHIKHSNIVKVVEVFDENNTSYYVMQYLEGGSLDDYISRKRRLSEKETVIMTLQVARALSHMHAHQMLHLDLKPKNIMLTDKGQACLIDFGLSKQFTNGGEPESSTSIGLGTPGYAPLEQSQYKPDGVLPVTLDIYALGATMYKMLTGERPPEASAILNDGFPSDKFAALGVDPMIVRLVKKAMSPAKKGRYKTVSQLVGDIPAEYISQNASGDSTVIDVEVVRKPFGHKKSVVEKTAQQSFSMWRDRSWLTNLVTIFNTFILLVGIVGAFSNLDYSFYDYSIILALLLCLGACLFLLYWNQRLSLIASPILIAISFLKGFFIDGYDGDENFPYLLIIGFYILQLTVMFIPRKGRTAWSLMK